MREHMSKIGRNAPCPCKSGKKYKKCCMEGIESKRHHQAATSQKPSSVRAKAAVAALLALTSNLKETPT